VLQTVQHQHGDGGLKRLRHGQALTLHSPTMHFCSCRTSCIASTHKNCEGNQGVSATPTLLAGRFNSHVDTWDAVKNQKYLSLEAVRHLLGQLLTFSQAPKLDTPSYTVLKKPSGYEVRE
jgi:hypothetical protein